MPITVLVHIKVIPDHDVAFVEIGRKLGAYIGFEDIAIHRPVDDKGCDQCVAAQTCNESLRPLPSRRCICQKASAFWAASSDGRHIRFDRCFTDKYQSHWIGLYRGQAMAVPRVTLLPNVGTTSF